MAKYLGKIDPFDRKRNVRRLSMKQQAGGTVTRHGKPVSEAWEKKSQARHEALKSSMIKSYQPDQMYSGAAMKRFSAKRKRLGHDK